MYKLVLLSLVFLGISCSEKSTQNNTEFKIANDSTLYYYKIGLGKSISIREQLKSINKAFQFVKKANKDSSLFSKVLYRKSYLHFNLQQYDSLLYFGNILIKDSIHSKNDYTLGAQFYLKAYYFHNIAQILDSAFVNYNLSKNCYQRVKDSSKVAKGLLNMGLIQKNQSDFFGSKETITEALQFINKKRDSGFLPSVYNTLATNHRKLLNYEDAIKYYLKTLEITSSNKDKLKCQNNLGTTYIDNRQFKTAISLFNTIIKDSLLIKTPKEYARVLDNLSYAKWLNGIVTSVEEDSQKALQIRVKYNDKRGQIASYTHLGEIYSKTNSKKAMSFFDSVICLSKTLKMARAEKDVLKHLIVLTPGNLKLRDRYEFLQDSLQTRKLKVKTQFAKYKYDDRLKQESILRLEKEKAEKDLALSKKSNENTIYLGGLLIIIIISGFGKYISNKQTAHLKQQSKLENLETIYRTEAKLSRRLHDDFGAKINHAMLLVQNKSNTSDLLDTLDQLYNQSRDFSRAINEVDTDEYYYKYLLSELRLHTSKDIKLYITGGNAIDWNLISPTKKTIIFKVLRELMINMKKYSHATVVTIKYIKTSNYIEINYSDNGVGASKEDMFTKNGLKNTEKRINAIKGKIKFDIEGKGFKVFIQIPN